MSGAPPRARATAADERALFLTAAGEDIFAVHTRPMAGAPALAGNPGIVLLQGGAFTPAPGRNRLWTDLARELAGDGFHVVRLDYRGVGESSGTITGYSLERPFVDEVHAAAALLRREGVERILLLGTCFGARTAMAAAPDVEGLAAVALFPVPVREFDTGERLATLPSSVLARKAFSRRVWNGLRDPAHRRTYLQIALKKARRLLRRRGRAASGSRQTFEWVSPLFVSQLEGIVATGAEALLVFGEKDEFLDEFNRGRAGPMSNLFEAAGDRLCLRTVDGKIHGLTSTAVQVQVRGVIADWLADVGTRAGWR